MCVVLVACTSPEPEQSPQLTGIQWTHPDYARGFAWAESGDSLGLRLFDLEGDSSQILKECWLPAQGYEKLACLSTTHLNLLKASEGLHHVVAAAYLEYVKDSSVVEMRESGRLRSLGSDGIGDEEVLLESGADCYLVYPFGGGDYSVIEAAGMEVLPISEYLEWHPLARAEWIRFTGRLVGHGSEADATWQEIKVAYEETRERLSSPPHRPVVFNGSEDGGAWFAPGGLSFISHFIRDAGGKYMFEDQESRSNIQLDIELFLERVESADYWGLVIYDETGIYLEQLAGDYPLLEGMPFFNEDQVFACNTFETDYFGKALIEPHIILKDLAHIFHTASEPAHVPVYFKLLEKP